jgi:hypothetical protein
LSEIEQVIQVVAAIVGCEHLPRPSKVCRSGDEITVEFADRESIVIPLDPKTKNGRMLCGACQMEAAGLVPPKAG